MPQPDRLESEQILLRDAGELLGLSRKGVQNLVNQKLLRSEVRTTPAGTKYGIVFRSEVLRLAATRRAQVSRADAKRGRGRPPKLPAEVVGEGKAREGADCGPKAPRGHQVRGVGDE
jgi:hypothetical protein